MAEAMTTVTYLGDFSNHDWSRGAMDFAAMRADGIQAASHKTSDGLNFYKDPYWPGAIGRMKTAFADGLYGSYHVLWGDKSITAQVDWWFSILDATTPGWRSDPNFYVMTDNEPFGYNTAPSIAQVNQAGDYIRQVTGKTMLAYCPPWFYKAALSGLTYPLVASNYGTNPIAWYPAAFPGVDSPRWRSAGGTAALLQYGSQTRMGSQSTCDANAYLGSVQQLRDLLGGDMSFTDDDRAMLGYMSAILRMVHWWWAPDAQGWANAGGVATEYAPVGGGSFIPRLTQLLADVAAVRAADTAQTAAIQALTDALNKALSGTGGQIDSAPILAAIEQVRQEESDAVKALQTQVADLTARLATAAQNTADAFKTTSADPNTGR